MAKARSTSAGLSGADGLLRTGEADLPDVYAGVAEAHTPSWLHDTKNRLV